MKTFKRFERFKNNRPKVGTVEVSPSAMETTVNVLIRGDRRTRPERCQVNVDTAHSLFVTILIAHRKHHLTGQSSRVHQLKVLKFVEHKHKQSLFRTE